MTDKPIPEDLNKLIHELRGLHWHEHKRSNGFALSVCTGCPVDLFAVDSEGQLIHHNTAYDSSLTDAFALVEWMRKERRLMVVMDNEHDTLWSVEFQPCDSVRTTGDALDASLPRAIAIASYRALGGQEK